MFLSVSFLFSSIFLSMPTIPTARVLPAYMTTKGKKNTHAVRREKAVRGMVASLKGGGKTNGGQRAI